MTRKETVVVLGASPKPERYSNKAVSLLDKHGYNVIPVNPAQHEIHGLKSVANLAEITDSVDTLTMYVNTDISSKMTDAIISLNPARIIFNPGTENPQLTEQCQSAGIEVIEACTLVMLKTGQF